MKKLWEKRVLRFAESRGQVQEVEVALSEV